MCKKVFYFCHCCDIRSIDVNTWKCFYSFDDYKFFERKNSPNHLIHVKYVTTTFGMCLKCQLSCIMKCSKKGFETEDFSVPRDKFKLPFGNKLTFKDISHIGYLNFIRYLFSSINSSI